MKKLILLILGVIVAGGIGAVVYISSIDWNEHKDKLATQFYEMTGKKISFGGPVSLRFMPYPSLTAENVKILDPKDMQARPLVEVKKMVAELSTKPLLSGVFDVRRMVLESPQINIELRDDGRLNWQNDENAEAPKAEIALNSVSLNDASVLFENAGRNIELKLENLSGEIMAQSLYGPYRLEGNYIKDGNPQGFAVSVGKLSDSFATSLNLVFTHPTSKSYVRFDGSFMLKNKVLNGNVIFESTQLKDFVNANFGDVKFDKAYDYPLALTFDVAFNERQLNLSNIVVKYGETQGAGNMQIPLNDGVFGAGKDGVKPRVDLAFNFTDFNLDPAVYTLQNLLTLYKGDGVYAPKLPFDLLADLKSVRTQYNGQAVKNFETSFDVIENIVTVNSISAVLPGDTELKLKGSISSFEDKPFYNLDLSFRSNDFLRTLNWAGIRPVVSAASTYKKASGTAKLSGTLEKIQISPFSVNIDKSSLSGEAGVKLTGRPDLMLVLNTDMINFDNYIGTLPVEEKEKSWGERMQYRFSKLGFMNDFDMQMTAKVDLGIYESLPFEKIDFDAVLLNGKLDVNQLQIGSVANATITAAGEISGFGGVPALNELNYGVKTDNMAAFINKLELKTPDLNYKKLSRLEAQGVISGDLNHFALNSQTRLADLAVDYQGQVVRENGDVNLNGDLNIRHPDFGKMLEDFNSAYRPRNQATGPFNMRSRISGNKNQFKLELGETNIGYNTFAGSLDYDKSGDRPHLMADLAINKFEIENFLNKDTGPASRISVNAGNSGPADFLADPNWDNRKIDYTFYNGFDLSGKFRVQDLSYYTARIYDASFGLSLLNGMLDVQDLNGKTSGGSLSAQGSLKMIDQPRLSMQFSAEGIDTATFGWSGKVYGITKGVLQARFNLEGSADSQEDFVKTLSGRGTFGFSDLTIKGWNLAANWDDIKQREKADGLAMNVKNNLAAGASSFNTFNGELMFENGAYTFSKAIMKGNGAEVKVYGGGTLDPWEMNMTFDVKYDEAKYLPGYSFSMKGPVDAPLPDVNVSALFDLYKSRQDKIDNDARIAREAEENRLKLLVEEQKNIANGIVAEIRREIDESIAAKSKNVYEQSTLYKYDAIRQKGGKLAADLVEKVGFDNVNIPDAKTVEELKKINQQSLASFEKMKQELKRVYLDDVKKNIAEIYARIVSSVNKSKQILFQYNSARDVFNSRLAGIETSYKLDDDVNIQGWDTFVKDKAAGFETDELRILDEKNNILQSLDEAEVTAYDRNSIDLLAGLETDLASMEETLSEMSKYAEEKVKAEEEHYGKMLRRAEVERKVEENKGSISIKKSGRVVEVVRDIEDIEKAEELVEDKEVRVLDFSKPKHKRYTPAPKADENVVKKGRGKVN